jgi:tetratricopeptide (TPR) repeat protein
VKVELELPSLAQKLKYGIDHNSDILTMVSDILMASNYYSTDERENIINTLKALSSKSKSERMKARADMLLERKKYISAANAYKDILNVNDEVYSTEFVATVWNNIGITYTKQFLFEDACRCFKTACDINRQEDYFDNMVCAAIFSANDNFIEDIVAQYQITEAMMDQYLKAIESNKKMLVKSKEFSELKERLLYDGSKEYSEYKKDVQKIFALWKEEYRLENM